MNIDPSARGILTAFFRQRPKIITVFSLIVIAGLGYVNVAHPIYESTGSLLVKFGHEAVPDVNNADKKGDELAPDDRREIIQSNIDILKSHDLLQAVVTEITPDAMYKDITAKVAGVNSPVEAVLDFLDKDLLIKAGQESNVIEIKMDSRDAVIAAKFIHRLMEYFIQRSADVYNNPQLTFLQEEVQKSAQQLADSQKELQDFKASTGVSSIDEELSRLIQQKGEAETIAFQAVGEAQSKLSDLKAKEAILLATYKSDSTPVKQIRESIYSAQRELRARQADLKPTGNDLNVASDTGEIANKNSILGSHIGDINRKIEELERQRNRYNDLSRQVKINEDNYTNYVKHMEDARLNATLNDKKVTRISVLDEPVVEMKPIRPKKGLILALAFAAGIILSFGLALVAETFDERFSMPEQISPSLNVPVMATFNLADKK